jgi:golgi-specific brefeldin A-resistance guanine nucleotide exchange factor 1
MFFLFFLEVLRRNAEHALKDIVQLLFMRLPQFAEDTQTLSMKALKIRATSTDQIHKKRKTSKISKDEEKVVPKITASDENGEQLPHTPTVPQNKQLKPPPLSTTPATPMGNIVDMQGSIAQTTPKTSQPTVEDDQPTAEEQEAPIDDGVVESDKLLDTEQPTIVDSVENPDDEVVSDSKNEDYVNSMGVRFIPQSDEEGIAVNLPYGLPCIRELFRFLITLLNPLDKQNTDAMIHLGLTLLTVSFEVGADNMGKYESLLGLVKDDLCRNLFAVSLNFQLGSRSRF